jgi:hypothetical protein
MSTQLERLGITQHQSTELYIPNKAQTVAVDFDGTTLGVNGDILYEFPGIELLSARILLYKTMTTPNTFVARGAIHPSRVYSSKTLFYATSEISEIFRSLDVDPVVTQLQPHIRKSSSYIIDSVMFHTGTDQDNNNSLTPQISIEPQQGSIINRHDSGVLERNQKWLGRMLSHNSEFHKVSFDTIPQTHITLFRILHANMGSELSIDHLRVEFNEGLETPLNNDEFLCLLTEWARTYTKFEALNQHIVYRRTNYDGKPGAVFRWQSRRYKLASA